MKSDKPFPVVIVGHVDHGKSTLIGRMLLDTESLPKEKLAEVKRIAKELGLDAELAYVTDQLKEERERNITIDTTQTFFKTAKRRYCIIDAPGHVEFLKNMMTGASLAEAAVLIVDAHQGVMEQTRRHAYLVRLLGIEQVIVLLNKMDLVEYGQSRYEKVKLDLEMFLAELGVKPSQWIPVSAKEGHNISRPSQEMRWYRGPTFLAALDGLQQDFGAEKQPFRFPVQDVYVQDGQSILVGRVAAGSIQVGQEAVILPAFTRVRIAEVKSFGQTPKKAEIGQSVGLVLSAPVAIQRGDMVVETRELPHLTSRFSASTFWLSSQPLELNQPVMLRCATQEVRCVAEKIRRRMNTSTLEVLQEDAQTLQCNETGEVTFKAERPLVVEDFARIEELGRFVVETHDDLQGAGIVTEDSLR